ncbi:thioredoxin family protein [Winogradskyella sp. UBA3174]|uniref:thioredoxin family protein n=1 Tax=Winogradskyella sp. UBA3174 TaxID=1947785 RepID=UPI0025D85601|nr:thioredoxin family protein [Winogradskyella sp. UBA3174]|tara:strand:- start:24311 stop:24928 length:618 start_codon:yes stop_codon:yes gene_type:complete
MEVLDTNMINIIISKSLKKGTSYTDYRALVSNLVKNESTTGNEKTEAMANYTMLNDRRMKRWDKTVKISETLKNEIKKFDKKVTLLVITESWCGDAAHIMPVINKVAELTPNINYKIVLRDENDELMSQFLTNGGKSIPKLIMIDEETKKVVNTFGPRPNAATKMVNDYKTEHGTITPEFKEDLQHWYNKDKGQSTLEDLVQLLK